MLKVGYGAMVLESLLAVLALCVAGAAAAADDGNCNTFLNFFNRILTFFAIVFWTTQLYQNQLVSCYFYASYY